MNHSRVPAHEVLGTRSTAKPTANTNKATTTITKVFIDRVIPTSAPLHPPLDQRGRSCLEGQVVGRVADPSLRGGQAAVLRPHIGFSYHVTSAAYSCERGGSIPQMSDV